jgi:NAD(P)-dependent dehydrogenase (short-subunit alcohol dehydrogenase family)
VLAEAQQRIKNAHPGAAAEILDGDAGIEEQSRAMVKVAIEHFGRLHILVGAAGIYEAVDFPDLGLPMSKRSISAAPRSTHETQRPSSSATASMPSR